MKLFFSLMILVLSVSVVQAAPAKTKAPASKTTAKTAVKKSVPLAKGKAAPPATRFSPREPASQDGLPVQADRSTSIDFEDDIIEVMNKNPFDWLTRVGQQGGANGGHLYRR